MGVSATRCGGLPSRGVQRGALEADRAGIAVREAGDARVFFAEPDAARQQHDGRGEAQPAERAMASSGGRGRQSCGGLSLKSDSAAVFNRDSCFGPEIPPNTGKSIRLCANTGATLHLVEPLGFDLTEPQLQARRAGLPRDGRGAPARGPGACLAAIGPPRAVRHRDRRQPRPTRRRPSARATACCSGAETSGPAALPCWRTLPAEHERLRIPMRAGQPQPESFQRRGRRRLRGLAPAGVPALGLPVSCTPLPTGISGT